jgi:hypothetical protein
VRLLFILTGSSVRLFIVCLALEGSAGEKSDGQDQELEVSGEESCEAEERKVARKEKGSGVEGEEVEESDFRIMAVL